ncbi:MAG: HAMP domain-containing histidine kinase [Ardenticatenales bacterium]|nr:HAMP domain-containing histidine kinase [Ardenticatenales bacterium]MCB9171335.1 HAMP domain-containing histidine kinase [Ardenticatenales bacterium]
MNSLSTKLTFAFLLVGLSGIAVLALLVQWQTNRQFDQFLNEVDMSERSRVEQLLASFYNANGSWAGIDRWTLISADSDDAPYRPLRARYVLAEVNGTVVMSSSPRFPIGSLLDATLQGSARQLRADGKVIGLLLWEGESGGGGGRNRSGIRSAPPETEFISNVRRALLWSSLVAGGLALVVGAGLAHNISRPVRTLTEASHTLAKGELGLQVPVTNDDELGELSRAFNRMSHDLARAKEIRQQMTADIAHDLRTPLTTLLGYTEALHDGKMDASEEIMAILHDETIHLQRLVDDLRLLSLADAGELPLVLQDVAIKPMLEWVQRRHLAHAQSQSITLTLEDLPERLSATLDEERFLQVLSNLVTNALRHTPAGGHIRLGARPEAGGLSITVADDGSGIDASALPLLFDRFYRVDPSRQSDDGHSGLGLAIVKSILEAHGGTVSAHSEGKGRGTTIRLWLPMTQRAL